MKHSTFYKLFTLVFLCASVSTLAQNQIGQVNSFTSAYIQYLEFEITSDNPVEACTSEPTYLIKLAIADGSQSPNSTDPSNLFSLQGGNGPQTFEVSLDWTSFPGATFGGPAFNTPTYELIVDDVPCTTCDIQQSGSVNQLGNATFGEEVLTITHPYGDSWDTPSNDGVHELILRMSHTFEGAHTDIMFNAVFVGASYTEVMGTFDAPAMPLYILRDPMGDASYSEISSTESTCVGQSMSVTDAEESTAWGKVKVGVSGSVGLIVMTDYEIYAEAGIDVTSGREETIDREYETCFTSSSTFTTPEEGPADDVFIGSAIRYAYGFGNVVSRDGCYAPIESSERFAMTPITNLLSYNYTESYIIGTAIPAAAALVNSLTPGTEEYKRAESQLEVWNDAIALNAELKAEATFDQIRVYNGGGAGQDWALETTHTQSKSIETSVYLDNGFSAEFGASVGGTGVSAGGEIRVMSTFGRSSSESTSTTNTMSYHLQDDDDSDNFSVGIKRDEVFSTFVFESSESDSTSCPYEHGYQLDKPVLYVGEMGTTEMTINNAIIGEEANFPLYVCNDSERARTYHLKFRAETNTEDGQLSGFGSAINGTDDGVELVVPANSCLNVANLELTQPNNAVVDFEDIEVYLYSLCEPGIRSAVTITAQFVEAGVDCNGVTGGTDLPGSTCDDADACTFNDVWDDNCSCAGEVYALDDIDGPTAVNGLTINTYTIAPIDGATSYAWTLPTGWTSDDNTALTLVTQASNTLGMVTLCVTATVAGCEVITCLDVEIDVANAIGEYAAETDWYTAYPNPSNGLVKLTATTTDTRPLQLLVVDYMGREVMESKRIMESGDIEIDLQHLEAGMYRLVLSRDYQRQVVPVVIVK